MQKREIERCSALRRGGDLRALPLARRRRRIAGIIHCRAGGGFGMGSFIPLRDLSLGVRRSLRRRCQRRQKRPVYFNRPYAELAFQRKLGLKALEYEVKGGHDAFGGSLNP